MNRQERERLRRAFRPARTRILFVGESPPASGRFFYRGDSGLYRAMRDAFVLAGLAGGDDGFLAAFQSCGCYLADLCAEPVDRLNRATRRAACRAGEKQLARIIAHSQPALIATLLHSIEENVTRAAARAGWQGPFLHLPYPGRWSHLRSVFLDALAPVLKSCYTSAQQPYIKLE